jgi:hypothetical protein
VPEAGLRGESGIGCGRGAGSCWSCFGSALRLECFGVPRFDVAVDYCVVEIVTRDGIKKGNRKIGFGQTHF